MLLALPNRHAFVLRPMTTCCWCFTGLEGLPPEEAAL